jgi:hypothetical protein
MLEPISLEVSEDIGRSRVVRALKQERAAIVKVKGIWGVRDVARFTAWLQDQFREPERLVFWFYRTTLVIRVVINGMTDMALNPFPGVQEVRLSQFHDTSLWPKLIGHLVIFGKVAVYIPPRWTPPQRGALRSWVEGRIGGRPLSYEELRSHWLITLMDFIPWPHGDWDN